MWELIKVEPVGEVKEIFWQVRVDAVGSIQKVSSGWSVPSTYTTFAQDKYDALWKMAQVLSRCGVPD